MDERTQPGSAYCLPPTDLQTNSLTLLDLGFFKKTRFEAIAAAGGYFLSRLQSQTGVYAQSDAPTALDLLSVLTAQSAPIGEIAGYLRADHPLPVRLVYCRLPPSVVNQRRRKAKAAARRRGEGCSKRHLALLEWSLFITNVPLGWLSSQQVLLVYRVRWQIEWDFKVWKSQARLNYIGEWRLERLLCQFYGHLLGLICFHNLVAPYRVCSSRELSLAKALVVVRRFVFRLVSAITHHGRGLARLFAHMADDFHRFALKTQRRKSPSTYQS